MQLITWRHRIKDRGPDEAFQGQCFLWERGASDGVNFDLFNFQKLSHAQHTEGQEKRCNSSPLNLKSFKFH